MISHSLLKHHEMNKFQLLDSFFNFLHISLHACLFLKSERNLFKILVFFSDEYFNLFPPLSYFINHKRKHEDVFKKYSCALKGNQRYLRFPKQVDLVDKIIALKITL